MSPTTRPGFWTRFFAAIFGVSMERGGKTSASLLQEGPDGLVYLFSESSSEQADLTRQILNQQGFHVEYVPEMWNGIYGRTGSPDIYVRPDEVQPILGFLKELRMSGENPIGLTDDH